MSPLSIAFRSLSRYMLCDKHDINVIGNLHQPFPSGHPTLNEDTIRSSNCCNIKV